MAESDARKTALARRDAAMSTVLTMDEWTLPDLIRNLRLPEGTAQRYITYWLAEGLIVITRKEANRRYFIAAARRETLGASPAPAATPEANMWRSMRYLQHFTHLDIAMHSNAGGVEISRGKARAYCLALFEAGFLKVRGQAVPGKQETHYQLVRNTGPNAPVVERVTVVADSNSGERWLAGAKQVRT
ncbi:hypothetical protein [Sagittula salina]|uniref:Uncharacterized protein n=1 Tax=Sagittula salina TaxID=2820268 RepID=A0A940MS21_9RHOB|nr:hypothetical protein [Sagittula salina]MBP0483967.1 hypothetical protein [Sagittula salina]